MSDLDPFGRKQGEDSLKEMGWTLPSSSPSPAATSAPASNTITAPPPATTPAPAAPRRRRRPRGGGGLLVLRFVIPIAILAAIGIGVGAAVTGVKHSVNSIPKITIPDISVPTTPSVTPAKPSKPPTGLSAGSLLQPAGMRAAVAKLRLLGRLSLLRIAADRINAQIVRGSTMRNVQVSSDGSVIRTDVTGAGAALGTFPWARVNAFAPSRMIRAIGRKPSTVNYLVLSEFAGSPRLYLYFKNGAYYAAGADGRHPQRIG